MFFSRVAMMRPRLTDIKHFPAFHDLPNLNSGEFSPWLREGRPGCLEPSRHWCLLAEITEVIPWPVRPMFHARDRRGTRLLLAFHLEEHFLFPEIMRTCKEGYTLCAMLAKQHAFVDGQEGLRIEDMHGISVLPVALDRLDDLDRLQQGSPSTCHVCGKGALSRCKRCATRYCGKVCQASDMKKSHKNDCLALQQLSKWGKFNWDSYSQADSVLY